MLTGLLAEDGKDRIVLKLQGGKLETIPRDQVDQVKTADVSLMPEEVEKQLSPQEIADLFAFLCLDKPPSDPVRQAPARRRPDPAASRDEPIKTPSDPSAGPARMEETDETDHLADQKQRPREGVRHAA